MNLQETRFNGFSVCWGGVTNFFSTIVLPLKSSASGVLWLYETPRLHLKREVRKPSVRFVGKILKALNPGSGTVLILSKVEHNYFSLKFFELLCSLAISCSSCAAEAPQLRCPVWNYLAVSQLQIWGLLSYHNYCSITCGQVSKWPCVCVLPFILHGAFRPGRCAQSCLLRRALIGVTFHSATGVWGGGRLEVTEKQGTVRVG